MTQDEYEFILADRIAKIQAVNDQVNLLENSYVAFSGGRDSCVLSKLVDLALPGNKIPRVYSNTGIEYNLMVKFVKSLASQDDRIVILNQKRNIKKTLEENGYPFKSKVFSNVLNIYQRLGLTKGVRAFLKLEPTNKGNWKYGQMSCPPELTKLFTSDFKLNVSSKCCDMLKKALSKEWATENKKVIAIVGLRKSEGGQRVSAKCLDSVKFSPLLVINDEWENMFIEKQGIKLCELYYPPYDLKRTGCKGCPFDLQLDRDLRMMKQLLPNEYKQCWLLWGKVYTEYKNLNYRLPNQRVGLFRDRGDINEIK